MAYTPTYCTGQNVIDTTSDAVLAAEVAASLEAEFGLIHNAEVQIDRFCGYWDRFGGQSQTRVFPRSGDTDSNGNSAVPEAVKFATIYQAEYNYINKPDMSHGIEEEPKAHREVICPRAKQALQGYVMKGGHVEFRDESPQDYQ